LRQAIKLDDDYVPAYLWLGGLLGEMGRLPEQSLVLQQAMVIDPLNELLAINVAGNLASQGDYQGAKDMLQNLVSLRPDSATLLRIMSGYALKSGELVEGLRYANQSYDLEPDSPAVIQTLADAWASVGVNDKAETLLLDGLEKARDNLSLQTSYFFLLLREGRFEKAERLLTEQFGTSIDELPEQQQQFYYFQKGMVSLVKGDKDTARSLFENAYDEDAERTWDGNQVLYATVLCALYSDAGNADLAEKRLVSAERAVRRARLNGVDDAGIYYTESSIHALRGESEAALDSLQKAYDRGFREAWLLDIDLRLDSLHGEPQFATIKQQIERDIVQARAEVESPAFAVR
jgi:tetratricopeptide (TPR) repeat protein